MNLGDPSELAATNLNPLQFMLDSGLNPQWLAMEGSRLLDEKRHRGEDVDEQGESLVDIDQLLAEVKGETQARSDCQKSRTPLVEEPSAAPLPVRFIVVDDDPNTAEQIASLLAGPQGPGSCLYQLSFLYGRCGEC